jgi:hypothetical protein
MNRCAGGGSRHASPANRVACTSGRGKKLGSEPSVLLDLGSAAGSRRKTAASAQFELVGLVLLLVRFESAAKGLRGRVFGSVGRDSSFYEPSTLAHQHVAHSFD